MGRGASAIASRLNPPEDGSSSLSFLIEAKPEQIKNRNKSTNKTKNKRTKVKALNWNLIETTTTTHNSLTKTANYTTQQQNKYPIKGNKNVRLTHHKTLYSSA